MRKPLFKLTLLVVALALLLSACAPTPTPAPKAVEPTKASQPAATAAQPTTAPTKAPEKPTDLELWYGGAVSEASPLPDSWAGFKIIRDQLAVNLKAVMLPTASTDSDTKIMAAAAANNLPDLFLVNRDTWYKLATQGLVAPVDKLLPMMPNRSKEHYGDPDRNKLATYNGVLYGLPDPGAMLRTDGLVIRKDWLDKLGLKAPKTLDEFLAVAKAFTENDPDGNGKNDTYGFGAFVDGSGMLNADLGPRFRFVYGAYGVAGMWNCDPAGFGLNVRDPNYLKATQFIKKLLDAKVVDPDWPTLKKDQFRANWKQGKYGIMIENFAALSTQSNYAAFDKNFPDGEWIVIAPPTGPDGKSSVGTDVKDARIYAVSKKAMDAGKGPAIARLLEWMNNDGYFLVGFGQEGVNYKLDKDGNVSIEGIDAKMAYSAAEQQPLTQMRNMVFINKPVELKARYVTYKSAKGRTMDPLSYYDAFTKQPYTNSTGAAIINPPSNQADFVRFYSENLTKFVLGQQPLDEKTWADFVKGLDNLGAKDLEANAKKTLQSAGFLK